MPPYRILADDLSGAAELAGLAFNSGHAAEVQRQFDPASTAAVLALDTATRQLPAAAAAARLQALVPSISGDSTALLYKKVDSLLRGNVRAEIEALLESTGYRRAILVPANPTRGRTIQSGRYLIAGQPLHESPLASDPHHPRRSSEIAALLGPGQLPLYIAPSLTALPQRGIIVPDVTSAESLAHLAAQIDDETLACGAADFFAHLLNIGPQRSQPSNPRPLADFIVPPAFLVCGSRIAWPIRQAACRLAGIPMIQLADGCEVTPPEQNAWLLGCGDRKMVPQTALRALAALAAATIGNLRINTVLVEGGETAAALAEKLHWTRLAVVAAAPAGIGALRPLADAAPLVLTKPGSYPWPEVIWHRFTSLVAF